MTLRARLTLFFVAIVVLPMVAATVVLQALIGSEIQRRQEERLSLASRTVAALMEDRLHVAGRETRHVAGSLVNAMRDGSVHGAISRAREEADLDFLIVTADGAVTASAVAPASYFEGVRPPTPAEIAAQHGTAAVLRARVDVLSGNRAATVTGGFFSDQELVRVLARATRTEVTLVSKGRPVASTLVPPPDLPPAGEGVVSIGRGREALVTPLEGQDGAIALVIDGEAGGFVSSLWFVVLGVLILVSILGYALANVIARPLQRLADGAMAVAQGDFDTYVDAEGQGDVARLAEAFNAMTGNLRGYVGELEKSRDELRHGLDRLGQSLRSTHDLEGMLGVILDTAGVTLGAKAGAVFLVTPTGRELELEIARGYVAPERSILRVGQGVAGRAAAGISVLVPSEEDVISPSLPVEPAAPTALAVPLIRGDRTIGVLALYGRAVPEPFRRDDVATLGTFASQASVAIENVLLHQEAQRLSITDGLTGVWNRRYLQLTFTKEIERAQRFDRPLSILMVDIDHFKLVNDEHGHQVGDEVLVELTRRMMASIRSQIDSLVRYGGEEFIVVLPETPRDGAMVVAQKILQSARGERFVLDRGEGLHVTVSIGLAAYPEDGTTADDLIRTADLAMYRAKEGGRDRVEAATVS